MRLTMRDASAESGQRLGFTSLIDIVFLLLVFFVMTFQISLPEGDFRVKRTRLGRADVEPSLPPIRVTLESTPAGNLARVRLGERRLADMDTLAREVRGLLQPKESPAPIHWPVVVAADPRLRYEHTIAAVSATTAYRDARGHVRPLGTNVTLAQVGQ